jgi:hypothetical protein
MDTWGYLILIAALAIVAALMLYARFASRSREKSVHHAPAERERPRELREERREEEASDLAGPASGFEGEDEPRIVAEPIASHANEEEEEYLDELQEAAAGLAMLMRSSPVSNRTNPVVFAPEEEEAVEEEAVEEEAVEVAGTDSVESVSASVEGAPVEGAPVEEAGAQEGESVAGNDTRVFSVLEYLGSEVSEQIDRIDSGLDDLENLVVSIEECLASLGSLGEPEDSLAEDAGSVEVAA